ncbi:MAG: hypothetical protein NTW45_05000 [Rhodocyclales bacterium]|nr:hypothetical protein [Rhodocyclales bacterium]
MPRRARLAPPNVPLHLIQRGNNRQVCFFADEDYRFYLDWLAEHAGRPGAASTVTPVNDAAVATDPSVTLAEDGMSRIDLVALVHKPSTRPESY